MKACPAGLKRHDEREKRRMEMLEAIRGRRSVRFFSNQPVSEEEVRTLIDAARHAPSAGNLQPWEFIIVKKAEVKRKLVVAALNQAFIEQAPVVIVVCANIVASGNGYGSRGATLYCVQDTAAATQNILLTAYSMGLGTCWIEAFKENEVKKALGMPDGVRPIAIIPVGHEAVSSSKRQRRPLNEITHYERF
jgi:nitroreductase